jgi:hydroxyacylglutathione hydrolase
MKNSFPQPVEDSDDERDMYSSDNHSLLPYLYMYKFFDDNIGYVLMDP